MSHDAPSPADPHHTVPIPTASRTELASAPGSESERGAAAETGSRSWTQPGRRRTAAIAVGAGVAGMVAGGLLAGVLSSASADDGDRAGGPGGRFGQHGQMGQPGQQQGQPGQGQPGQGQGQQGQPPTAP
jgi:hypothetical protein